MKSNDNEGHDEAPVLIPRNKRLTNSDTDAMWRDLNNVEQKQYHAKQDGNQGWKVVSTFNGIESDTGARNFATQTDAEEWMRTNQAP